MVLTTVVLSIPLSFDEDAFIVIFFSIPFLCLSPFAGIISWKLYRGNQWWKLAEYQFLFSTLMLAILLFTVIWDWKNSDARPAGIPPDEVTFITCNELVEIIVLLWGIFAPFAVCVIAYVTNQLVFKQKPYVRRIFPKVL